MVNKPSNDGCLRELALFAGAGGGILGGHLLGWRTVCAVEWEQYPASVLCARQNDKILPPFPIWDDVQTFDGKPWRGIVDVVSGGFPCQDISAAGKGTGIDGERSSMWKHMARIIGEIRPQYAFVENSPMLVTRGLERVLANLTSIGYDCKWVVMGAADVGANHKRNRIWIRARRNDVFSHSEHDRLRRWEQQQKSIKKEARNVADTDLPQFKRERQPFGVYEGLTRVRDNGAFISNDTNIKKTRRSEYKEFVSTTKNCNWKTNNIESIGRSEQWATEPNVGRVANGVASRVDRLKAIGNGQVPLCAATAWRILSG